MLMMDGYRKALASPDKDVRWAEVNAHRDESVTLDVSGGEVTRTGASLYTAYYVRACGEHLGLAYTQDGAQNPSQLIRQAVENGRYGSAEPFEIPAQARKTPAAEDHPAPDLQTLVDAGHRLNSIALACDNSISYASSQLRADTRESSVINSSGLDVHAGQRLYSARLSLMGQKDGRQYNAAAQVTAATPGALNLQAAAGRAAGALIGQYAPRDLKSGFYPLVLDSSVVINIMTTAWQLFSGQKMIKGSSALFGRLGQAVGSGALSISDSPIREGCGYSFQMDHEGVEARANTLVRSGVLENLLHTQATASHFGVLPTGNSGRVALLTGSLPTELIPVPRVLCLEPGQHDRKTLLSRMGEGLLISQSFDVFHSVNIGSGDFSIPCRGSVVRDGRCQYNVTGLTLSGNLLDLMRRIEETGSDLWIDEFLLKSYCIGAPSIRLSGLQVNGKG